MTAHKRIPDTYFLDPLEAYKTAILKNKSGLFSDLQICYYDGVKIENTPPNMIHLPMEKIYDFFLESGLRFPTDISFNGVRLTKQTKKEITQYLNTSLQESLIKRNEIMNSYKKKIKKLKLNFNEPLRVFFITTRITSVMQYIVKNLALEFEALGYETFISIEANEMMSWGQNQDGGYFTWHLKNMLEFKPHITININYLNNDFLPEEIFNFIWFQDIMPIMTDDSKINLRKRDFIFHLTKGIGEKLLKRNINSRHQPFCINTNIFKKHLEVKKEKKIVFIGNSYIHTQKEIQHDSQYTQILSECITLFEEKSCFTQETIETLMKEHRKSKDFIIAIYSYLMRDYCIEKLCKIENCHYSIEIYGNENWKYNPIISNYYKGPLKYGENIAKVYNSATYGYCVGGYILMQRTLECAASETIPLVLDVREANADLNYNQKTDESLEFFHIKDLEKILTSEPINNKDSAFIKAEYSYKQLTQKYLNIVKNTI